MRETATGNAAAIFCQKVQSHGVYRLLFAKTTDIFMATLSQ